ncbi:MAG: PspA/IM30 family protein [Proteobacteria bacterium]|nr:PspA/IM30 family protein [Pseudomonadota bacterium]
MGIFNRISTLFKSEVNAGLDKMEDPEKILNQLILDMSTQLNEAKKQVAVAIADEKRLKKQLEDEEARAVEWERKAMMAVQAGRDDLASEALGRKGEYDSNVAQYRQQWEQQKAGTDRLRSKLKELNTKIEDAKRKKNLLVARQKRAKATATIHDTLSGMDNNSAFGTFDRMAEKVDRMEAEAAAKEELSMDFSGGDDLEKEFRNLKPAVNSDALAALKAKMGVAPAAPVSKPAEQPYGSESYGAGNNKLSKASSWDDV